MNAHIPRSGRRASLLPFVLIALLASCTGDDGPVNPTPEPTGVLVGTAVILDANQRSIPLEGATARIDGRTQRGTSDALGRWTIDSVPAGVYDIVLSKPGYSTEYRFQYQFVGRDTAVVSPMSTVVGTPIELWTLPAHSVELDEPTLVTDPEPAIRFTGRTLPHAGNALLFIDTTDGVAFDRKPVPLYFPLRFESNGRFTLDLPTSWIVDYGFVSGTTLHAAAYPVRQGSARQHPVSGRLFFTDLVDRPSNRISIAIP